MMRQLTTWITEAYLVLHAGNSSEDHLLNLKSKSITNFYPLISDLFYDNKDIFLLRIEIFIFNSFPSFVFPCKCKESCIELGTILCKISKSTRKHCKHCRYQKCLKLAGMKMKLAVDDKRQLGWTQSISQNANLSKPNVPNESPIGEETVRTTIIWILQTMLF